VDANIVIGKPIVELTELYLDEKIDLFTEERFLPRILVEMRVFKSVSEVRKNRPDLVKELNKLDFMHIKVGKKHLWITVGE